ncbi:MAG: hypothetical protein ABSF28_11910 [Terracidiphilus sp.]|jgi:hypothetical protein
MNDTERGHDQRRQEAIEAMRKMRFLLPKGYKFNREEIYDDRFDRSVLGRALKESILESGSPNSSSTDLD